MKEFCKSSFELAEPIDPTTFERISMFEGHALQVANTEVLPLPDSFNVWIFALLLFGFVVFAWLLSFNIKRLGQIFNALLGNRGFNRLIKDGNLFSEQLFLPLVILLLIGLSLFAFRVGMLYDFWSLSGIETLAIYGQVIVGVGILYLVKVVIIKIRGWIFKEQVATTPYLQNLFVFNSCLALMFFPLLLVAYFGDAWLQISMVYFMIFLFVCWFIWRSVRSFLVINSATKLSYVHNFLYLCTLEIGYYLLVYVILSRL